MRFEFVDDPRRWTRDTPPFADGIGRRIPKSRVKLSAVIEVHITLDASAELRRGNAVIALVRQKKVSIERSINTENK